MRITRNFIVRFFKGFFTRRKKSVLNAGGEINVSKHWKVISIGFIFLLILLGLLDGYVAWRIKKSIEADVTVWDVHPETISRGELEKAISELEAKEKMFIGSLTSTPPNSSR